VAFELIFGTAIVNSYLIYKENYAASEVIMLQFRESLVRFLPLGMWFEIKINKSNEAQTRRSQAQRKKRSPRDVRRCCTGCYEKIRQQNQEKQVMRQQKNKSLLF
jgi:hypothetical protein